MKLSKAVRARFQREGRRGGRTRARNLSAAERRAIARKAALSRWVDARFGSSSFSRLGLPGGDMVDQGLDDLAAERESAESLLVSVAAPRLRREGVPVPDTVFADAAPRLYRLLERLHGPLAHARYLAHLRQAASFADACHRFRGGRRAR